MHPTCDNQPNCCATSCLQHWTTSSVWHTSLPADLCRHPLHYPAGLLCRHPATTFLYDLPSCADILSDTLHYELTCADIHFTTQLTCYADILLPHFSTSCLVVQTSCLPHFTTSCPLLRTSCLPLVEPYNHVSWNCSVYHKSLHIKCMPSPARYTHFFVVSWAFHLSYESVLLNPLIC